MYLKSRQANLDDLSKAFPFIQERLRIPSALREPLLKMWQAAMIEGLCLAPVVVDTDQTEGQELVALALTFQVNDSIVNFSRTSAPPYPWRWMLEHWQQGRTVWLARREARNAEKLQGANIFAYCYGVDSKRYGSADFVRIQEALSESFIQGLARRRMRFFVEEVYGPIFRDRHLGFGCDVWRDYKETGSKPHIQGLSEEERPFLMGGDFTQVAENLSKTNTVVGKLALPGPPRFNFKIVEQETMLLALQGLTDEAIADQLGLSLVAIKKRWQGIYQKIDDHDAQSCADLESQGANRLKVRRRQVLQMMSEHPEEFWA
jgi:hypothetical protein